jgi:hypothetical protein
MMAESSPIPVYGDWNDTVQTIQVSNVSNNDADNYGNYSYVVVAFDHELNQSLMNLTYVNTVISIDCNLSEVGKVGFGEVQYEEIIWYQMPYNQQLNDTIATIGLSETWSAVATILNISFTGERIITSLNGADGATLHEYFYPNPLDSEGSVFKRKDTYYTWQAVVFWTENGTVSLSQQDVYKYTPLDQYDYGSIELGKQRLTLLNSVFIAIGVSDLIVGCVLIGLWFENLEDKLCPSCHPPSPPKPSHAPDASS